MADARKRAEEALAEARKTLARALDDASGPSYRVVSLMVDEIRALLAETAQGAKALDFIREIAANKCRWTPEEGTSSCDGLGGICTGHRAEAWLARNAETAPAPPQAREVEAAAEVALVTLRNGAAHLLAMKDGAHNCHGCGLLHAEWREAATLLESALARGGA